MAWRAARSLTTLHAQLKAGAPAAAPPATPADAWGLIGDALHDPSSDHAPHDFPGWGTDIVTAADFPHAPALGLNSRRVCEDIRVSRDQRVKYMISQDEICSAYATTQGGRSYAAWAWRPYQPTNAHRDRHDTHAHLSVVGDARADGTQPWQTIGAPHGAAGAPIDTEEDDMGQSWPAFEIAVDGVTSYPLVETQGGGADPRPQWLRIWNETGGLPGQKVAPPYALRILGCTAAGGWSPVAPTELVKLDGGKLYSWELKKGITGLSITRCWIDKDDNPISPLDADVPAGATEPYAHQLRALIERGPVVKT